jgi:hypothetical protein
MGSRGGSRSSKKPAVASTVATTFVIAYGLGSNLSADSNAGGSAVATPTSVTTSARSSSSVSGGGYGGGFTSGSASSIAAASELDIASAASALGIEEVLMNPEEVPTDPVALNIATTVASAFYGIVYAAGGGADSTAGAALTDANTTAQSYSYIDTGSYCMALAFPLVKLLVLLLVEMGTSGSGGTISRFLDARSVLMNWDNSRRIGTSS